MRCVELPPLACRGTSAGLLSLARHSASPVLWRNKTSAGGEWQRQQGIKERGPSSSKEESAQVGTGTSTAAGRSTTAHSLKAGGRLSASRQTARCPSKR